MTKRNLEGLVLDYLGGNFPGLVDTLLLVLFVTGFTNLYCQKISNSIKLNIGTKDPIEVELIAKSNPESHRLEYYYLPVNLRLSFNQQLQPELLFMAWSTEGPNSESQGILHWILTWGLTAEQEEEVQHLLITKIDSSAVLMGAISVQPALQEYNILGSNDTMIQLLLKNVTSGRSIPANALSKSATAFKFSGVDALIMLSSFKTIDKWKQVFIEMPFIYAIPQSGISTKKLRLEVKTIFKQLANCKECYKLI